MRRWRLVPLVLAAVVGTVPTAHAANTISAQSASAAAGTTVTIPIALALDPATQLSTLQFNLTVIPGVAGLSSRFVPAASLPSPTFNLGDTPNVVLVGWLDPIAPPVAAERMLGTLVVSLPGSALPGDTYEVVVLFPSGVDPQGGEVALTGVGAAVTVAPPVPTTSTTTTTTSTSSSATASPSTTTTTRATATTLPACTAGGAGACDDGDHCTDDACDPGGGCTHALKPPDEAAAVTCRIENMRDIVREPPQPVCPQRCPGSIEGNLGKVAQLVDGGVTAPSKGKCTRKLRAARRVANALQRRIGQLVKRASIVPTDRAQRLGTQARKLADEATTLATSAFCARR